ncbi:MAG TPA: hypothetical protein VMT46_14430 [Anaerolineaceae bacterium]|nr:hypothetical protein [Anaerolineaceae bacterium]
MDQTLVPAQTQAPKKKKPTWKAWATRIGADTLQVLGLACIATGLIAGGAALLRIWTTPNSAIKDLPAVLLILFQFVLVFLWYQGIRLGRFIFENGKKFYTSAWSSVAGRPRNPFVLPRVPLVGFVLKFIGVFMRTIPPLVLFPLTLVAYLLMYNLKSDRQPSGNFAIVNLFSFTQILIVVIAAWLLLKKGPKAILKVTQNFGTGSYVAGMKLSAGRGEEVLEKDTRPPVLYLRSFQADTIDTGHIIKKSQEQTLASVFNRIGPFVAIGDPGEPLPELGAARLYVGKEWKEVVEDLVCRARLVVLRAGSTPGFWWEFEHVTRSVSPEKILLLIPFDRLAYEEFSRRANAYLPRPLPEYRVSRPKDAPLKAMVYFRPDWTSYILPTPPSTLLSFENEVMWSLEPVFQQFNLPYQKPEIKIHEEQRKTKIRLKRVAGYLFLTFTLGPLALLILWFLVNFLSQLAGMSMWKDVGVGIQQLFQNLVQ